jgi:hypothetical protein
VLWETLNLRCGFVVGGRGFGFEEPADAVAQPVQLGFGWVGEVFGLG